MARRDRASMFKVGLVFLTTMRYWMRRRRIATTTLLRDGTATQSVDEEDTNSPVRASGAVATRLATSQWSGPNRPPRVQGGVSN